MNRVTDLEIATAENFDEIKFEEKFRIQANKFGLAGKEFLTGMKVNRMTEFDYPDERLMVDDTRVENDAKVQQKVLDDLYKVEISSYYTELSKYEKDLSTAEETKKPEERKAAIAALRKPIMPTRRLVDPSIINTVPKAFYREVYPVEFHNRWRSARKLEKEYEEKKQQLCAELMCHIDDVLRTTVQQHEKYQKAIEQYDVKTLFEIVKDCATGKGAHSTYVLVSKLLRLRQKDDSAEGLAYYNNEYSKTVNDLERLGGPNELWKCLTNAKYIDGLIKDGLFHDKVSTVLSQEKWPEYTDFGSELMRLARATKGIQMLTKKDNVDGHINADAAKFRERKDKVCFNCGKNGHITFYCKRSKSYCKKCNKSGHLEEFCEIVTKLGEKMDHSQGSSVMKKNENKSNKKFKVQIRKKSFGKNKVKARAADVDDESNDDNDQDYEENQDNDEQFDEDTAFLDENVIESLRADGYEVIVAP